jgi:hypothetical protein
MAPTRIGVQMASGLRIPPLALPGIVHLAATNADREAVKEHSRGLSPAPAGTIPPDGQAQNSAP